MSKTLTLSKLEVYQWAWLNQLDCPFSRLIVNISGERLTENVYSAQNTGA
jgi:hypothetical protein